MKISCLILVLACTHLALAAKRASTSSNRARSTTVSSILPDEWRDPYMYSLFEMTLSTIDSKLRKIENLDRAVELLTQRLDSIDRRLSDSTSKVDVSLSMLQNIEARLAESSQMPETYAESLEPQILALDEKISSIGSKLNVLAYQLDSNTLSWSSQNDSEPYGADASEQSKTFTVPTVPETPKTFDDSENIRMSISSVDRHLKVLIELFSEQMDKMFQTVNDIRSSLMGQEFHEATSTTPTPSTEAPFNTSSRAPNKLDALYQKMSPLLGVSEKMDEVWNVLVGTKSSVDTLVPTSEALLWQTQRQERAISSIHNDLNVKTEQIIGNLNLMERYLAQQKEIKSQAKQSATSESASDIRPRAAESQIRLTYKPNSTNSAARENRLQHDPPSTSNKSTVDEAAIALPTDIMDSEFLHDDPEVQGAKASNTTKASSSQISPLAATTTRYPVPAGPTERSRVPTHSSVIFPSVKNKPGFSNSTFFYNYTKPQNIRGHSCAELKEQGLSESGIYYLLIPGTTFWYLKVYCDMETANGGWTVIQRRDDFDEPRENFNRDWDDYKNGFGDTEAEFWLGNENIYMLTNAEDYSLRVDLEDFEGNKRYAEYSSFKLHSEREQYKLEIGGYTGDAGDSLNDPWYGSNLSPFSTYNRDNDRSSLNCASMLKGGWWWKSCGRGLNGIYLTDPQDLTARQGIVWFRWRGWDYTLKRATMMIRPRHYAKDPSTPAP